VKEDLELDQGLLNVEKMSLEIQMVTHEMELEVKWLLDSLFPMNEKFNFYNLIFKPLNYFTLETALGPPFLACLTWGGRGVR